MPSSVKALRLALTALLPENQAWATGKTGTDGDDHSTALTKQNTHATWRGAAKQWIQAHPHLEQLDENRIRQIVKVMRQHGVRGTLQISDADVEQVVGECQSRGTGRGGSELVPVLVRGEEEIALACDDPDGRVVPALEKENSQKGRVISKETDAALRVWMSEDAASPAAWQKLLAGLKHLKGMENKSFSLAVWLQIERQDTLSVLPADRSASWVSTLMNVCQPWPTALKDAQTIAEVKSCLKLSKAQADYFEMLRPVIFRADHLRLAERTAAATSRIVKASFTPATMESAPEGMEQSLANTLKSVGVQFDAVVPVQSQGLLEFLIHCRDSDEATTAVTVLRKYQHWDASRIAEAQVDQ